MQILTVKCLCYLYAWYCLGTDTLNKYSIIYDPSEPVIDMDQFPREDWSHSVYASGDTKLSKPLPSDAPEARGEGFVMRLYVDSDHAGDCVTRRSRTGSLVYLQS